MRFPSCGGPSYLLVILLLLSSVAQCQRGALTRPSTLEELAAHSHTIVHGYVVSTRIEPHPQFPDLSTVVVNMKVVEVLKGDPTEHFTFRQFVWDVRDKESTAMYGKGQELLLLLRAPSRIGLSSPEGLEQGRFRVEHLAKGKTRALNGNGNMFLFAGTTTGVKSKVVIPKALRDKPNEMSLDQLKQMVRAYVGGQQ
jgi:hypothetical protein